jgi:hypothetical protein
MTIKGKNNIKVKNPFCDCLVLKDEKNLIIVLCVPKAIKGIKILAVESIKVINPK